MISVAITTYNGEKYIEKQLYSILNQTKQVDEIIVVDDCSSDSTFSILEKMVLVYDKIKIYKNDKNIGYTKNFYKAISKCFGDYIFLADQDDIWNENKVEIMINTMQKLNCSVLCSNFEIINSNDNLILDEKFNIPNFIQYNSNYIEKIPLNILLFGNVAQGCTYCFDKEVQKIYLKINNGDIIHDLQIMIIGTVVAGSYFINEKLIKYRIHETNSIGFNTQRNLKHIKLHFPKLLPKMALFLKELNSIHKIKKYKKYMFILILRLPVIKAVYNRFKIS